MKVISCPLAECCKAAQMPTLHSTVVVTCLRSALLAINDVAGHKFWVGPNIWTSNEKSIWCGTPPLEAQNDKIRQKFGEAIAPVGLLWLRQCLS